MLGSQLRTQITAHKCSLPLSHCYKSSGFILLLCYCAIVLLLKTAKASASTVQSPALASGSLIQGDFTNGKRLKPSKRLSLGNCVSIAKRTSHHRCPFPQPSRRRRPQTTFASV